MGLIRVDCPRCAKGLKAPENYAGRRVQCTSPACRHIFILPQVQMLEPLPLPSDRRRNPADDFQDDESPRGRPVLRTMLISLLGVLLAVGAGWGVYWRVGQPASAQVAAYETFLRAGNELIDLQMSFDSGDDLYAAEPQLRAKAREMMAAKKVNEGLTGRRKAALEERFKERQGQLQRRAFELLSSGKPGALLSPEALAREPADYRELGWPARKTAPAKPVPPAPPKFDPASRLQQIAGVWDAKGFSFTLEPDGRGKALFIGKFSQGSGTFSVQDKNGAPVEMAADFQVEFQGEEPRFAFTLEPSQGLECKYSFAVLPSPSPDLLIVKELGGGRLELNPVRMKRRLPGASTSTDRETEGEWKMDSAYIIHTGKESQQLVVKSNLLMRIGGGTLEYSGLAGGMPKTSKFNVTFNSAASPKRFRMIDPRDPNNLQEGYYRVDGDVLLMRTLKRGSTNFSLDVTSDSVRLDKNPDGKDSDVPAGFLMQKGDPDNIIRYVRPKSAAEPPPPMSVDLDAALRAMKGKWLGGNMTFTIEAGGGGAVSAIYRSGNEYSVSGSRFDVTVKNNKPNISFRLGAGANMREYAFAVTLTDDPDEMQLKEANGLVNPNPLVVRRAGSAKPVPKKPADAKPYPPAPPKGTIGLSDLKITKTTFDPPGVEFTVRLHDEGGEFLEAWASVGIPNPAELVKTCAGAIDQGLLSVNGIDFADPDPALKVQRVTLKKGTVPGEWVGTVKYPKVVLEGAVVDFGLAAALRLKNKIEKTNAAVIRLDLKTGAVIPAKP